MALRLAYSRPAEKWSEQTDEAVVLALAKGSEPALAELIARKTDPLVQFVYRMLGDLDDARDVVQVTFLRVWEHRERFDRTYSVNTWVYRIASNLAIDLLRSRGSRARMDEPVRQHLKGVELRRPGHLEVLQEKEVARIFEELADALPERQRAAFLLREVEGMSGQEVAAILGCRESTVRNHVFNARRALQEALAARYPEYLRS